MKKIILLISLILILVAVDWFKPAVCQTMDKEQEELLKKYQSLQGNRQNRPAELDKYSSPPLYSESEIKQKQKNEDEDEEYHANNASVKPVNNFDEPRTLKPFGYDLFNNASELTPPSEVADLADYILGPGDNIVVFLWGRVEKEYNLTIDRQGRIIIPKVGEIVVHGMSLSEIEAKIKNRLSTVYSDFKISVSLGKIRSIRIYLTGEVLRPGAYTVSSLTTLFNALYLAGGPNQRGSMRDIKLLRNNKIEAEIDLYKFLLEGDNSGDVRLSSGDAIFIPVTGPRVSIEGEIKRPAIYEMVGGETVSHLLTLAGGPTALAYLDRIMLDRISPDDERQVVDINLNPKKGEINDIELSDGDQLSIFSIYDLKRNFVSIAGLVKHPGRFERTDSTSLCSLLDQAELLSDNVYYERANLFRTHSDYRSEIIAVDLRSVLDGFTDLDLQDKDSLHIYGINEIEHERYVYIDGEIKRPGQYSLYDNMTIEDLIFLAGSNNPEAFNTSVELARTDQSGNVELLTLDLTDPNLKPLVLKEDDHVFIRKKPGWLKHRMVTIRGEVKFPGRYALSSYDETLFQLINRTGGFTDQAFPRGITFQRQSITDDLRLKKFEKIIADSQPLREDSLGNIKKMEYVEFDPEQMNRIILDVDQLLSSGGKKGDVVLQNGDYIFIPEIPTGVSVMGAVGVNGTIKYTPDKSVKYYIERAGNFSRQADKKGTRLIKADGHAFSNGGILGQRVDIGDVIIVPTEIKKDRDWFKTISTSVSIIGGLVTTALIIDRL